MQLKWKKQIDALQRVQVFLAARPVAAPATYAEPKEILDDVIEKVRDYATIQVSGQRLSQAEKEKQEELVRRLREHHLRPIAAIAKATLSQSPGIVRALRMPAGNLGVFGLLSAARSIRTSISLYEPVFVKNGRPADFLEQLDAAIAALAESVDGRGGYVRRHVGAKAGIRKELSRGRRAVGMLDSIVRVAFEGQADVLAEWAVAKRVQSLPTATASATDEVPVIQPETKLSAA
jgi:hypothetical protein